MFSEKSIIHISQFDFENDQPIKGRYFIVIANDGNNLLILSAATSTQNLNDVEIKVGCNQHPIDSFHCYHFPKKKIIGVENSFSFPQNTFIYVNRNIQAKEITSLNSKYVTQGLAEKIDTISHDEYEDLLYCIYQGKYVTRGIKSTISSILEKICK